MKVVGILFIIALTVTQLKIPMGAESYEEIIEKVTDGYDIEFLEQNVPDVTKDYADDLGISLEIGGIDELFNVSTLVDLVIKCVLTALKDLGVLVGSSCALSLFCFVIRGLSATSSAAARLCETVSVFTYSCLLFDNVSFTVKSINAVLDGLSGYVTAALPITLSLVSAAGRPSFAAASGTLVYTAVAILGTVISTFVPLFTCIYFCLASISVVSENNAFDRAASMMNKITTGIVTFTFFVFTGIGIINSLSTAGSDTLVKKGIKYAAGAYIPVAGGYISDGLEVWFASIESLRNTGGVFGIAVICITVAVPLCSIIAGYGVSYLCEVIFFMGGNTTAGRFLKTVKDVYAIFFSMLCGYAIMLCSLLALMMRGV